MDTCSIYVGCVFIVIQFLQFPLTITDFPMAIRNISGQFMVLNNIFV